jgi:hypothetical protein
VADRTVLARYILILEYDASASAIVLRHVGTADKVDDLVGLDGAGARIHRIRTNAGDIIDLESRDGSVALDPDPASAAMVAGVNVCVEALRRQ